MRLQQSFLFLDADFQTDKCGKLFTEDVLKRVNSSPLTEIWKLDASTWTLESKIKSWVDLFDQVLKTPSHNDGGQHWKIANSTYQVSFITMLRVLIPTRDHRWAPYHMDFSRHHG